jgi:uncharacterized membrane protein
MDDYYWINITKSRLEAFSDGLLAIIITIMVLEIKVPNGSSPEDLKLRIPIFVSYVLSFIYIGIFLARIFNELCQNIFIGLIGG